MAKPSKRSCNSDDSLSIVPYNILGDVRPLPRWCGPKWGVLVSNACGTVEKALFSVTCTTCRAQLGVRNLDAIGAILECPKCSSMVQIVPPEGWTPPGQVEPPIENRPVEPSAKPSAEKAPAQEKAQSPAKRRSSKGKVSVATAVTAMGVVASEQSATAGPKEPATAEPAEPEGAERPGFSEDADPAALGPADAWVAPTEMIWRKWLLWTTIPAAAIVVAVSFWSMLASQRANDPAVKPDAARPDDATPGERADARPSRSAALPEQIDRRWLPEETTLIYRFHASQLAEAADAGRLTGQAGSVWHQTGGAAIKGLGLKLEDVERLTWASTDLKSWPSRSVAIIDLRADTDPSSLDRRGKPTGKSLFGASCRQIENAEWGHPFARVGRRTIVSGDAELMRHLDRRAKLAKEKLTLQSATIDRLLEAVDPSGNFLLLVDLDAVRRAKWQLPVAWLDVWPPIKQPWHTLWETPAGLGFVLTGSEPLRGELAWLCRGGTATTDLKTAAEQLLTAAKASFSAQLGAIPERLQNGEMTAAVAHQYETLLKEGLATSEAAVCESEEEIVWIRTALSRRLSATVTAAMASEPAVQADWMAAAHNVDRTNHETLIGGLMGHQKAEGQFPSAAAGGALLAPDTRLSWIAAMLPYYGHAEDHRQLNFGYSWNDPRNRAATQQPLPQVVNPALGPSRTPAGFPVTHYVGVSGIGANAGELKADDPRAGVFGYGRKTRSQDIADGAANTIAVLGVTGQLGPWASGGTPTVRPLTQRPYVNGPDGFGSGQAGGMLAGMADGSVRFVSKDIDPRVLEQLASINGQENATVAALDPHAADPPEPPPAEVPPVEVPPEADLPEQPPIDRGPPPVVVDVEARLAEKIPEIELPEVPLAHAVGLIAGMSTLPITLDPDAMQQLGVALTDPVSVQLKEATVGEILEAMLSPHDLAIVVEDGHVLVTRPSDQRLFLRDGVYSVDDLVKNDPAAATVLAEMVRMLIAPETWHEKGGRGSIAVRDKKLMVRQTADIHHRVLVFCQQLRRARGLPLRGQHTADQFSLATRYTQAAEALNRPVTANFHQPTPLLEVLSYLGQETGTFLLVDRLALSKARLSDQSLATLTAEGKPLGTALNELLGPMGLSFRIIDSQMLQITSEKVVLDRLELEFFPIADRVTGDETAASLIERIKERAAGSTWSDAGGPGVVYYDAPSRHLIVLQSQPVQIAVQRVLREKP